MEFAGQNETYQQVFWFQVAVDDIFRMQERERFGEVGHHVRRIAFSKLHALCDRVKQIAALSRNNCQQQFISLTKSKT